LLRDAFIICVTILPRRLESSAIPPVFALALLKLPKEPPQPLTPMLADDAPAKVLIEHRLDPDGQSELDFSGAPSKTVPTATKPSAHPHPSRRKSGKPSQDIPSHFSI
jgi:hypothetical protein